ncbi:UNVERIFIED_CONTAM: Vestitone reductase [Sesamum angustifolium]|uniref:Vestitone reductase n=1 Tax=Sesamum angustifolium TaxID=2727405 RepID=A0AAW2N8A7_9LAMI
MEEEREQKQKGRICVTGGTGYLGSWTVKRLLEDGYSVNTTVRMDPEGKRDISYLINLPGASERLQIFDADLDRPDSFAPAIGGCVGVFHVAHPLDFEEKEAEEVKASRVYFHRRHHPFKRQAVGSDSTVDEDSCTDVDFVRRLESFRGAYVVTKTLTERTAMEFAEKHGLDLVVVAPSWIHGPFICPRFPDSVYICMALILGTFSFSKLQGVFLKS